MEIWGDIMSRIYNLNDKPYELKAKDEFVKEYEEATGKEYTEPTENEKKDFLKRYAQYMTEEQKKKYNLD